MKRISEGYRLRLLFIAAFILGVSIVFLSCGKGPDEEPMPTGIQSTVQEVACPESGTYDITVQSEQFTPNSLDVPVDAVVKWTNNEPTTIDYRYWIISENVSGGTFKIEPIRPQESACLRFTAPGSYEYHCDPGVGGLINVTAPASQ